MVISVDVSAIKPTVLRTLSHLINSTISQLLTFKRNFTRVGLVTYRQQQQQEDVVRKMRKPPSVVLSLRHGNNINDIMKALQRISSSGGGGDVTGKAPTSQQGFKGTFEKLGDVVYGMFDDSGDTVLETNGRLFVLFTNTPFGDGKRKYDGSVKDVTDMRSELTEHGINTLFVDVGKNNVGKIEEVSGGGEDDNGDNVFHKVVSVRRDDLFSLLPDIVDSISKAKKDNSKTFYDLIFPYLKFLKCKFLLHMQFQNETIEIKIYEYS